MDYSGIPRGSIRGDALKKLAKLSVENSPTSLQEASGETTDDFFDLLSHTTRNEKTQLSDVAISPKEFEVLIALCESTASDMKFPKQAKILLDKIRLYLLELPNQKFSNSVFDLTPRSSPWNLLGEKLTTAAINLGRKFNSVFLDKVLDLLAEFNEKLFHNKTFELSSYLTLLGFIEGLVGNAWIFHHSEKSFNTFITLDTCIDNFEFLNEAEIYSNVLYSQPNGYSSLIDRDVVCDFSPILYIERLSKLQCSIIDSILGNTQTSLLEYLLTKASRQYEDNDSSCDLNSSAGLMDVSEFHMKIIDKLSYMAVQKMEFLDRGETYIVYSSFNRLKTGYLAKSINLHIIGCGTFTDNVDISIAKKFLKNCLSIYDVMLDINLGLSVIQLGSLLVFKDEQVGPLITRAFTSLVANPKFDTTYCLISSKSVGLASKCFSQDAVVTTIYALTNLLFIGDDGVQARNSVKRNTALGRPPDKFATRDLNISRSVSRFTSMNSLVNEKADPTVPDKASVGDYEESDYMKVCENAIIAIIDITQACNDETISTLAVTILSQKTAKLNSRIGDILLKGLVSCAPFLPNREFIILSKLLNKLSLDALEGGNSRLLNSLIKARISLSHKLKPDNPLFKIYLHEILQAIISKGDVRVLEHHRPHTEISEIGDQIGIYLQPLAELLPDVHRGKSPLIINDTSTINLFRNIWFNMVVHGYSINSKNVKKYRVELERIAYNSPPLASELSWDRTETSLELNTVLRRGSSNHNVKDHRHIMGDIFEVNRTMSYPKLMFVSATVFVESLRVKSGDCSTILQCYSDPSIKTSNIDKYIGNISNKIVEDFVSLVNNGGNAQFTSENIAEQLTCMLALCCHRIEDLQDAALQSCDTLINKIPSSLCHHKSLFALFDLLTLLFESIVDADENQYEPKTSFRADRTGIQLLLSDSYKWRNETFKRFHDKAKSWLKLILVKCNVDVKALIQSYISGLETFQSDDKVQYGVSFALEMAGSVLANDRELSNVSKFVPQNFNTLPVFVSQLSWRSNLVTKLMDKVPLHSQDDTENAINTMRQKVVEIKRKISDKQSNISNDETIDLLSELAGLALVSYNNSAEIIRYLVEIPFAIFESSIMKTATGIWFAVMKERPNLSVILLSEIAKKWESSIKMKQGLYSTNHDICNPEFTKMEYSPSDRKVVNRLGNATSKSFDPHMQIIKLFASNFEATLYQSDHLLKVFTRFVDFGLRELAIASLHPYARVVRFELIRFAFHVLNYHIKLGSRSVFSLTEAIFDATLSWFRQRASYPFGSNLLKTKADYSLLQETARLVSHTSTMKNNELESKKALIMFFLDDEISKISVWLNPINSRDLKGKFTSSHISGIDISNAYKLDPILAVNLALRYKLKDLDQILQHLITENPLPAISYPDAVQYFIGINSRTNMPSHHLLFWEPLSPIDAITLFLPPFGSNPYILQYTMRSLEHHDTNLTFFYVPQIVQSLRFDAKGYVERFILETAKVSQLFAHQIIWNMLANSYKDEDSTEPDSLKPVLDRIQDSMLKSLSKEDFSFYEKEFGFFNEVTSISGKLKPYIKKSKAEKKVKIDEEMAIIEVKPGVYLPSNPDGVVVDINRKSGKPLQSHAKAPFMATFKIKKDVDDVDELGEQVKNQIEKWQSAIFKVGDDCRQDVLALQLISVFRTIWSNAGLDLFVYPYRVTATAPGCGVIDVLPNSVSRDMLGREAVNGLYEYFTTKFGPENSIEFQKARNNLIKSLAAYSIISYILQFKDRHNGNIMYDDQGHVLHIDFGFCFDIVPGGVKFEVAPFKLTHEMVMVLGGRSDTQAFQWFEELCVKGFLACRPYMETIVRAVNPMLESGLPCFKPHTIKKLRSRFAPRKSEKEASLYMRGLIKKSMESYYTKGYDEFQRLTNGIPY